VNISNQSKTKNAASSRGDSNRLLQLDALRALAIILVLLTHLGSTINSWNADVGRSSLIYFLAHAGWIGVPLFFVLSGFLIGHMLQREDLATGKVDLLRFLTRRGLKIYPPFYVVVFAYSAYLWFFEGEFNWERFLREVFFIQNYGIGGIMDVSWSLAVEEHFYLSFGVLALLTAKLSASPPPCGIDALALASLDSFRTHSAMSCGPHQYG